MKDEVTFSLSYEELTYITESIMSHCMTKYTAADKPEYRDASTYMLFQLWVDLVSAGRKGAGDTEKMVEDKKRLDSMVKAAKGKAG